MQSFVLNFILKVEKIVKNYILNIYTSSFHNFKNHNLQIKLASMN